MAEILKIANEYGNTDVVPKGYVHVSGQRLQPLCRKLKIKYCQYLSYWGGTIRYPKPVFDGVVIHVSAQQKLLDEITARNERQRKARQKIQDKRQKELQAAQTKKEQRKQKLKQQFEERYLALAVDPDSRLLRAILTVNRSAKRYRDAAKTCFSKRCYEFSTVAKQKKDQLYILKDKGISEAVRLGLITANFIHGGFCLYEGNGFSFHSRLCPKGLDLLEDSESVVFIEAKKKEKKELKLGEAIAILEQLPQVSKSFRTLSISTNEYYNYNYCWF